MYLKYQKKSSHCAAVIVRGLLELIHFRVVVSFNIVKSYQVTLAVKSIQTSRLKGTIFHISHFSIKWDKNGNAQVKYKYHKNIGLLK